MSREHGTRVPDAWARMRFAVVGQLLAAPPTVRGGLRSALVDLAERSWKHPITGELTHFRLSTIERWYYLARGERTDPVLVLRRKVRRDRGTQPAMSAPIVEVLAVQYRAHPGWSFQLHVDNLATRVREDPALGPLPSYATVRRHLKGKGMTRQPRLREAPRPGEARAAVAREHRETRSYEVTHVHGLWHLDFHLCSRKVLLPDGRWVIARLMAIIDDHSRLICHAQWYATETAADLVHALSQAIQKRGLPRQLFRDNGAAMVAAELHEGLAVLGIVDDLTRPYSPEQNAKVEIFWAQVEGRLMAMLEGHTELTLALLNEATLAWIEGEYHRKVHRETGQTPFERFCNAPSVGRPSPSSDALRRAFRRKATRKQRRSDGTFTLDGVRFEVPSRYRHLAALSIRYASWDLSCVDLYDEPHGTLLCAMVPLDKAANADGRRRVRDALAPAGAAAAPAPKPEPIAPRLRELMAQYAVTGLPPAYLPRAVPPPHDNPEVDAHGDLHEES